MEKKLIANRYEIIEMIGMGGMATVYKAKCQVLNRFVAIKILKDEYANDQDFVKRFHGEAQACASLSQTNIVSIYDVGKEDNLHFIVMEYVEGITLNEYTEQEEKKDWTDTVEIVMQICQGVSHAHSKNIVHRDIKPHNILMTSEGGIKVADFGIAKAVTSSTITMSEKTMGSVHYFSPEQARGGYVDARSDLYSIGIILYKMLSGNLPFQGDSPVAVAIKHIQQQPINLSEFVSDIPEGLSEIVSKCIKKNPDERYQTAIQLLDDLKAVYENPKIVFDYASSQADISPTLIMDKIKVEAQSDTAAYKDDEPRVRYKQKNNASVILGIIISAIIIFAFFFLTYETIIDWVIPEAVSVMVQDYVGEDYYTVKEELENLENYNITIKEKWEYSDGIGKGKIISQDLSSGMKFMEDAEEGFNQITFVISEGVEQIVIPSISNSVVRVVENDLDKLGISYKIEQKYSQDVPEGLVIRTNPSAGLSISPDTILIVYESLGKELENVLVPSLTGLTLSEATLKLEEFNLYVGNISPDGFLPDAEIIVEQYPKVGVSVKEETEVAIRFQNPDDPDDPDDPDNPIEDPVIIEDSIIIYTIELSDVVDEPFPVTIEINVETSIPQAVRVLDVGLHNKEDFPLDFEIPVPDEGYTKVWVYVNASQFYNTIYYGPNAPPPEGELIE